jgi:hypothetical protein
MPIEARKLIADVLVHAALPAGPGLRACDAGPHLIIWHYSGVIFPRNDAPGTPA